MSYLVECNFDRHSEAILEIFNDAIRNSTALYDYQDRSIDDMQRWFQTKSEANFPVVGLESDEGELMGFASYGSFRPHTAFMHTIEHSVYVHPNYREKGIGRRLLTEIIQRAKHQDFHLMLGVIDSTNSPSIHLHKSLGFTHSGTLNEVGYKFERWLDVVIYQLKLKG